MKAYRKFTRWFYQPIMRKGLLLFWSVITLNSFAQNVDSTLNVPKNGNQPDVKINVNRELDNEGNVIRYDSTYSWSWSSDGSQNGQQFFMNDSNNAVFFKFFDGDGFPGNQFMTPYGGSNLDSLFSLHFNNPGLFEMEKQMQEMMQRQQQLMNEFFGQPPLIPTPEQKENNDTIQKAPPKKTSTGVDI